MGPYFSGVARYNVEFNMEDFNPEDKYKIVFEKVKESVLIRLNGHEVTTLFAHPFEVDVSAYLQNGKNQMELEVANLPANRIRYLDKQGVTWQKFYDINFVNINYKKFDASKWDPVESGLISDVSILCFEKKE
jgi:predicted adenine nucleotide alpha hydrolase (AANH) superfamily ATPase